MKASPSHRRGYELNSYPDSFSFVLVNAELDRVSHALASLLGKVLVEDVYRNAQQVDTHGLLIWQYTGHVWTMFQYLVSNYEIAASLSQQLHCDCIQFEHEDTSGWIGYSLFREGVNIESYSFGLDYREEIAELSEEFDEEMPEESDRGLPWDINTSDEQQDYQFLFRSLLRSVSEDEVKQSSAFLNHFFASHNAWLPDWDDMPRITEGKPPEIPKSHFIQVDWLKFGQK